MKKQTKYGLIVGCIILVICGFWYKNYQEKEAARLAVASEMVIEEVSPLLNFEEFTKAIDENINKNTYRNKSVALTQESDSTNQNRIFTQRLFVSDKYQPAIVFYCQTKEEGDTKDIDKILYVDFDRNYEGSSKAFHGDIFVRILLFFYVIFIEFMYKTQKKSSNISPTTLIVLTFGNGFIKNFFINYHLR